MTQIPPYGTPAAGTSDLVPPVIFWFKIYAAAMAAMYFFLILLGGFLIFLGTLAEEEVDPLEMLIIGGIFGGLGLAFCAVYAAALFLPRKPWVWVYDVVMIAIGLTSCLTMIAAIPLLIYWIKPEVQRYFGRNVAPPARA